MSNQAPEPVAWMRDDGEGSIATTTDVITKRVRDIWLKANPRQIERYTIELYLATPDAAQIRAERDTKAVRALAITVNFLDKAPEILNTLRQCADEIDALRGQALSSIEREEYFAMKEDALRYRWLKKHCTEEIGNNGDLGLSFACDFENYNDIDESIDRARKGNNADS